MPHNVQAYCQYLVLSGVEFLLLHSERANIYVNPCVKLFPKLGLGIYFCGSPAISNFRWLQSAGRNSMPLHHPDGPTLRAYLCNGLNRISLNSRFSLAYFSFFFLLKYLRFSMTDTRYVCFQALSLDPDTLSFDAIMFEAETAPDKAIFEPVFNIWSYSKLDASTFSENCTDKAGVLPVFVRALKVW